MREALVIHKIASPSEHQAARHGCGVAGRGGGKQVGSGLRAGQIMISTITQCHVTPVCFQHVADIVITPFRLGFVL